MAQTNPNNLPVIHREIASVIIFSADGKILMGRKDPKNGGVYSDSWHIPGGGVEEGETLVEAALREAEQEVGMKLVEADLRPIDEVGEGEAEKTLKNGEKVWCNMRFNRFEVHLDTIAESTPIRPGDDLAILVWFSADELRDVKQIPGGKEFFERQGYLS